MRKLSKSRSTGSTSGTVAASSLSSSSTALYRRTVTGVSCRDAIFGTGELVLLISFARFYSGGS